MKDLWTAFVALFKELLGPFIAGVAITNATNKAKVNEERADALEARVVAANTVNAMPVGDSERLLKSKWNLQRPKSNTRK